MNSQDSTQLIEEYLNGTLSDTERQKIEHRIQTDPVFKLEFEAQKNVRSAVQNIALKQEIKQTGKQYQKVQSIKKLVSVFVALAIATSFIFYLLNSKEQTQMETNPSSSLIDISFTSTIEQGFFENITLQTFALDNTSDTIIEAKNGTTFFIPKNTIKYKGEYFNGEIKMVVDEALSLSDMVMKGYSSYSDDKALITDGMFYFNFYNDKNEALSIDSTKEIYVSIPSEAKLDNMMLWDGELTKEGKVNWKKPKPIKNYLVKRNLDSLDFLPNGFREEVRENFTLLDYKKYTDQLADSMYYYLDQAKQVSSSQSSSLDFGDDIDLLDGDRFFVESEDAFYTYQEAPQEGGEVYETIANSEVEGISPPSIQTLKTGKFKNTYIATKEFENRLQTIFQTCDDRVLEAYVNNIPNNLFEADSIAAELTSGKEREAFKSFFKNRHTNVNNSFPYKSLTNYFYKKRNQLEGKIKREKNALKLKKQKEKQKAEKTIKKINYQLNKVMRERYYTPVRNTGFKNVDKYAITIVELKRKKITIQLANSKEFQKIDAYAVAKNYKSIQKLFSWREGEFEHTINPDIENAFNLVVFAYVEDSLYSFVKEYNNISVANNIEAELKLSSVQELTNALNGLELGHNLVREALLNQKKNKVQQEVKRKAKKERELNIWKNKLYDIAHPCYGNDNEIKLTVAEYSPIFWEDHIERVNGLKSFVEANYIAPKSQLKNKLSGKVRVHIHFNDNGVVDNVEIQEGFDEEVNKSVIEMMYNTKYFANYVKKEYSIMQFGIIFYF